METPKIYGWYSKKYVDNIDSVLYYYENINGEIVAITNISHDPNDSMTKFPDIQFVGELKKFHHNEKIY